MGSRANAVPLAPGQNPCKYKHIRLSILKGGNHMNTETIGTSDGFIDITSFIND